MSKKSLYFIFLFIIIIIILLQILFNFYIMNLLKINKLNCNLIEYRIEDLEYNVKQNKDIINYLYEKKSKF